MLRKQRTVVVRKEEIDFHVKEFYVHDSAVLKTLGSHSKEMKWVLQAGLGTPPLEIKVVTDSSMVGSTKVGVVCGLDEGGRPRQVHPLPGPNSYSTGKLKEDIRWSQKFRGSLKNLGVKHHFEVRQLGQYGEAWYPATVVQQRADGCFEAVLLMPDTTGQLREVNFPAIALVDVREAASKNAAVVPERVLTLDVPKDNPLHSTLSLDGDPVTHFFGRPTPPAAADGTATNVGVQTARIKVNKLRTTCTAAFGPTFLNEFLKSEAQLVSQTSSKLKRVWDGHSAGRWMTNPLRPSEGPWK